MGDRLSVGQSGFDSAGTSSSIVSLSVMQNSTGSAPQGLCMCCTYIALDTLFKKCDDNGCASETYQCLMVYLMVFLKLLPLKLHRHRPVCL